MSSCKLVIKDEVNVKFENLDLVSSNVDLSGLEVEDVIIKLGEVSISNSGDLSKYLISHPPGSEVVVTFYRDGLLSTVELTLASAR